MLVGAHAAGGVPGLVGWAILSSGFMESRTSAVVA